MLHDRKFGLIRSPPDNRDFELHVPTDIRGPLPPKYNLRPLMPPVLDQESLGSCASNASSNIIRYLLKSAKLPEIQPSRLFMYYNTRVKIAGWSPNEDTGACMRDICKAISKFKVCDEPMWPYVITNFNIEPPAIAYQSAKLPRDIRYAFVPQELDTIKNVLLKHIPILAGIMIYDSFYTQEVAKSGMIPMPDTAKEKQLGGHAVVIVGYDDEQQVFICQNSWGVRWGIKGFFNIPYKYMLNNELAFDFWALSFVQAKSD